ncbi:hypothetical protein DESUT3_06360 [Desulfuromonas versatilis]|uniref:Alkyl hydroperoxide reductase subunit C/ Thiol specific antioxidant domain-containing protein n=1 Tax=Desulfuromonas versatilis TaxID=2802975 RepID=A0ABM8HPE9_9BACT|nr:hypothetical protein DESUT3_06360 [Desulfuromonas versatilis]
MGELVRIEPQLLELGYQILAVSADKPEFLKQSQQKHKPNYRLLSDSDMQAAQAFGIAFQVDTATYRKYQEFGVDLEEASGRTHHLLPVPTAFVVGSDGTIRFSYANPDYKTRVDSEVLLAAARAALK